MSDSRGGAGARHSDPGHGAQGSGFRSDIEGLRAVAILLVVLDHLDLPGFGGGFVGVDVFFVISGFLITSLLVREYRASRSEGGAGRISFASFYLRRARRILPAALLVIAATLVVAKLALGPVRFAEVQSDALWATFFAANFDAMAGAADSLAWWQSISPLQNYWSLAVEEQFYLVWPALFAVVASGFGFARRGSGDGWLTRVLVAVVVVSLASLAWSAFQTGRDPMATYFSTFARAWQLGLGAVIALAWATRPAPGRRMSLMAAFGGVALIIAALTAIDRQTDYPGLIALLPTCGAALVILAGIGGAGATPVAALLSLPPVRFIGRISYSLYLWHWPIVVFAGTLIPRADLDGFARGAVLFGFSIAVAWLSWLLVEQPFRVPGRGVRLPAPAKAAMAAATIATIAVFARPFPAGDPVTESLALAGEPTAAQWRAEVAEAAGEPSFTPVQRKALVAQSAFAPTPECFETDATLEVALCAARGSGGAGLEWPQGTGRKVLLAGDGFAAQWRSTLLGLLPADVELVQATSPWCDPFSARAPVAEGYAATCARFREWLPRIAADVEPSITVIGHRPGAMPEDVAAFASRLGDGGSRVLWLGAVPGAPRVDRCLPPGSVAAPPCNGPIARLDFKLQAAYSRAAAVSGSTWLDLASVFCSSGICPAMVGPDPVRAGWLGGLTRPAMADGAPWLRRGLEQVLERRG